MKTRKTTKAQAAKSQTAKAKAPPAKAAKPKTRALGAPATQIKSDVLGVKPAIRKASTATRNSIAGTEMVALNATEQIESKVSSALTVSLAEAREIGTELIGAVDHAGRTAVASVSSIQGELLAYGRDALNDTVDTGRQSFGITSMKDAIEIHTAFTERRLAAAFKAVGTLNALAHTNTMAMWWPLADMLRAAGDRNADAAVAPAPKRGRS